MKIEQVVRTPITSRGIYPALYVSIALLRILLPIAIFRYPLFGFLSSFILDGVDGEFASHRIMSQRHYEIVDKVLDFWWYVVIFVYVLINYPQFLLIMAPFLIFRFIGDVLYLINGNRRLLFYFPNFYENIFILIFLGTYFPFLDFLLKYQFVFWVIISMMIKIVQEYWLHVKNGSVSEQLLHLKKKWLKKDKWEYSTQ